MTDMEKRDRYYQIIVDTLADDIYENWLMSAQDDFKKGRYNTCYKGRVGGLRELSEEAAVTALGYIGALLADITIQKNRQNPEKY